MAGGRPTTYTDELADLIIDRLSTHSCGINKLCKMYDDMPDPTTIALWRLKNPQFSLRYLESRIICSHLTIESIGDLMDESQEYVFKDENGNSKIDSGMVSALNFKLKAKAILAAKLNPRDYGVKQQNEESQAESKMNQQEVLNKMKEVIKQHEKDY